MIDLYTSPTPNGHKVSIALEEMKLEYNVINVNLMAGDQKLPEYLKLNPNGRIPTIVDRDNNDFAVFESGAILMYLGDLSGKFFPTDPKKRSQVVQWLMFQMAGVGPMMGQANVFYRYFPDKIQPVIDRYQKEVKRLFTVLDSHLATNEYLVGEYSIADIANWAWVRTHYWSGVEIEDLIHLHRWVKTIAERPSAKIGIEIPTKIDVETLLKSAKEIVT
jgi:glutathione S-transferase